MYLAAVLEYLTAEVLELAGNAAKDLRKKRIMPRHIQLSVRGDDELDKLFAGTIAAGGVMPHIHKQLVQPKKNLKSKGSRKKKINQSINKHLYL